MSSRTYRLYVHDRWPRCLGEFLAVVSLSVVVLYPARRDLPKLPAVPLLVLFGFLVLASHRASQCWTEVSHDGQTITAVPSAYRRSLIGEKTTSSAIRSPAELLVCRNIAYGSLDGYSAVLRGHAGAEQTVWKGLRGMDVQRCCAFSREMQLEPVLLLCRRLTDRAVEETDWTSDSGRVDQRALGFGFAMFLLLWLGVLVLVLTANAAIRAAVGVLLQVFGVGFMWVLELAPLHLLIVVRTGSLLDC